MGNKYTLEVRNLHVRRAGRDILRGVHLGVARGSIHAVIGPNGSGKSTLAFTLMGASGYVAHTGEIRLEGEDITQLGVYERARRGVTLAWQEPARFEGLTVERYIGLGMSAPDRRMVRESLRAVNLDPDYYLQRCVDDSLSGGERKRVELAAISAMQPKLAVLDEADSGIDTLSLKEIARFVRRMARRGTAVLLISHHDDIVATADRASLLCGGEIVETGKPKRVCGRYAQISGSQNQAVFGARRDR